MSSFEIYWMIKRQAKAGTVKMVPKMSATMARNVSKRIDADIERINLLYEANRIDDDKFTEGMKVVERMLNAF